jgi:hypothetical protein
VFAAVAIDEVYYLPTKRVQKVNTYNLSSAGMSNAERVLKEWHLRLGHVSKDRLVTLLSTGMIEGTPKMEKKTLTSVHFFCNTCALAKARRMSYRGMSATRGDVPLHTLHMDTTGKMKVKGIFGSCGYKYALAIVDDATGYKWYFPIKSTKEVSGVFSNLITQLEAQTPFKIKRVRTDGGGVSLSIRRCLQCVPRRVYCSKSQMLRVRRRVAVRKGCIRP